MHESKTLSELVRALQKAVQNRELNADTLDQAITKLAQLGYKEYDSEKFPGLSNTASLQASVGDAPQTLAEALLWKLGKWKVYKSFVENYKNKELKVSPDGGVVFSAFTKHLQDNDKPIYDQHAIRAIWAIGSLNETEEKKFESLLFDRTKKWKDAGSGDDGSCYELFVKHINVLCTNNGIKHAQLDRLLMPLGQAIKKGAVRVK